MSCSACVAHVERAAEKVCGKGNASVSLLTNSMTVETGESEERLYTLLKKELKKAGYTLEREGKDDDGELKRSVRRLVASGIITLALMIVSMGHMLGIPMPSVFETDAYLFGLLQLALSLPVIVINFKFFKNGFRALFKGSPNMDSLIAIGSGASMIYGAVAVGIMVYGKATGNGALVDEYRHNLYFEGAAMILTLVSLGKLLEGRAKVKAAGAIRALSEMMPDSASVLRDGEFREIPISEIRVGDIIELRAGDIVPADGCVIEGICAIDESALSGESIPIQKAEGDGVRTACTVTDGYVKIKAEKIGEETSLLRIIRLLEDAASSKAPISRIADKVSSVFVPSVIAISVLTAIIWIVATRDIGMAFQCAVSVLVISCPCALGLATPTAIMVGTGRGARLGILVRSAESLENLGSVKYFLTDKTGTLTEGKPVVTDVVAYTDEKELFEIAYLVESKSSHPLASAICEAARERGAVDIENFATVSELKTLLGRGIRAELTKNRNSNICLIGTLELFSESGVILPDEVISDFKSLEEKGRTAVLCTLDGKALGILGIFDKERSDSAKAVSELKKMHITPVMLTGDNDKTARAVCDASGIDTLHARLLPEDKEALIREYSKKGLTAMVGDGINDAPALAAADVGIAVGAGTEVAIDSADVVLSKSSLCDAVSAISLSKATMTVIKENLFWALIYNAICIPVAAGALYPAFGVALTPMIASAAMSFSSLCVVLNSLRLKYKKIYINSNDNLSTEDNDMFGKLKTVTVSVEGMMCNNCKAHVERALLTLKGVKSAEASVENKNVVIVAKESVSIDSINAAIITAGYRVV
ncbi:MAG: heavy metal translocating P-type ATPase [Clostridia bacterium]|nr:heavy metal translocating P-type ATPase [Clostridia bacterium]